MPISVFLSSLVHVIETYPATVTAFLISALIFIPLAVAALTMKIRLKKAVLLAGVADFRWQAASDPIAFEQRCAEVMRLSGWSAQTTKGSGDQGIDVIAEKKGVRVVIQCKCYRSTVGNKAVQQVFAGRSFAGADHAAVVTNSRFSRSARELARSTGVHLLHFTELRQANAIFGLSRGHGPEAHGHSPAKTAFINAIKRLGWFLALISCGAVVVCYQFDSNRGKRTERPMPYRSSVVPAPMAPAFVTARIAVYIRNAPAPDGEIIRIAASGERFRVFGNVIGWTRIGNEQPVGWIASSMLADD